MLKKNIPFLKKNKLRTNSSLLFLFTLLSLIANITIAAPPVVNTFTPLNSAVSVNVNTNITIAFADKVKLETTNTKKFTLTPLSPAGAAIEFFPNSTEVSITGGDKKLVINPPANLAANTIYEVTVEAGFVLDDDTDDPFAGVAANSWRFSTGAATAISSRTPTHLATNVPVSTTLVLTYSRNVVAGAAGKTLTITPITPAGTPIVIDITSPQIVVATNTLTVTLSANLNPTTQYEVTASVGLVKDAFLGTDLPDIATNTWRFTTINATSPTTFLPANNATGLSPNVTLKITYSANVKLGTAGRKVVITPINPAGTPINISIEDATQITFAGADVTIVPTTLLNASTQYEITMEAAAVFDDAGNYPLAAINANTWRFTTGSYVTTTTLNNICVGGTFANLGTIKIQELAPNDFAMGTSQSVILTMPANFELQAGVGNIQINATSDISNTNIFVTPTAILLLFDVNTNTNTDFIEITGLRVRALNAATTGATLTRTGGSATLTGFVNTTLAATFNSVASPSAPTISPSTYTYCVGTALGTQNITATPTAGNTIEWYAEASLTTLITTGATVTASALGANSASVSTKVVYVIQKTPQNCVSNPVAVTINIIANPVLNVVSNAVGDQVCFGQSVLFTALGDATEFEFTFMQGVTTLLGTAGFETSSTFQVPNTIAPGTYQMHVSARRNNCTVTAPPTTIVINPVPNVTFEPPPSALTTYTVNQNTPVDLSAWVSPVGGIFAITSPSPAPSPNPLTGSNFTPSVAGIGVFVITYSYTDIISGCTIQKSLPFNVIPASTLLNLQAAYCTNSSLSGPLTFSGAGCVTTSITCAEKPNAIKVNPTGLAPGFYFDATEFNDITAPATATLNIVSACPGTVTSNITTNIFPAPSVNTITGNNVVCANKANENYSVPPRVNSTYTWVVTGGVIVGANNQNAITVNWGSSGTTGVVSVIQTDNFTNPIAVGCPKTLTMNVTINPLPMPVITGVGNTCADANENYTTPSVAGHTYLWTLSPASAGQILSGETTNTCAIRWSSVSTAVSATLSLTQRNGLTGCEITTNRTVTINPNPNATFTGSIANVCAGLEYTYTAATNTNATYIWSFTNAVRVENVTPDARVIKVQWITPNTTGAIRLNVVDNITGCTAVQEFSGIDIRFLPVTFITGTTELCEGTGNVLYQTADDANSYAWSVVNGTILSGQNTNQIRVAWNIGVSSGTVSVVKSTAFCSTNPILNIIIRPLPNAVISGATSLCPNTNGVSYSAVNPVAGHLYQWQVTNGTIVAGQGTPTITVNWGDFSSGLVRLTQTDNNFLSNCPRVADLPVLINTFPQPTILGSASVCAESNQTYTAPPIPSGNTYTWTITGGTIVTTPLNPTTNEIVINWGTGSAGTITLVQQNASGCIKSTMRNITINPLPTPSITGNFEVCEQSSVNTYSITELPNRTYSWLVTGGFFRSANNRASVVVDWEDAGIGSIQVTETNTSTGCTTVTTATVILNALPNAAIAGAGAVCPNQTGVVYSVVNPALGHTYQWNVIGGVIVSGQNTNAITVNWGDLLSGQVVLTQTNQTRPTNCLKTVQYNVLIQNFTAPTISGDGTICALSSGNIYTAPLLPLGHTYTWEVTGGTITSPAVVLPTTTSVGITWGTDLNGTIRVIQRSPANCVKSVQRSVTILPLPNPAIIGNTSVCAFRGEGAFYEYVYSTTPILGHTYNWVVTNGVITEGAGTNQIRIRWDNVAGIGTIALTQLSNTSPVCSRTVNASITINPTPLTDIIIQNLCLGDVTTFTPTQTNPDWTWEWAFSDNTNASGANPTKVFDTPGLKRVDLRVTTAQGCLFFKSVSFTINPVPRANFSFLGSCSGSITRFTNSSIIASPDEITGWVWDFGDGTTLSGSDPAIHKNPVKVYTNVGVYIIRMTVISNNNCTDTKEMSLTIYPSVTPSANLPYTENFENGTGGWFASSGAAWQLGIPDNTRNIKTDNAIWTTGLNANYANNTQAYVESPCIDLNPLERPMFAMRIWSDSDIGADGAALLVTYDDGQNWENIGIVGEGLNWYDRSNILGNPGTTNFNTTRVGWTGKYDGWRIARYNLDPIKEKAQINGNGVVRFRIAFGSNADNPLDTLDGFAFDDIFIGNRSRNVLLEHFTATNSESIAENDFINNFPNPSQPEIINLHYYTNFAGENQLNKDNPADPSARALFYGVSKAPRSALDGKVNTNNKFSTWGLNEYRKRTLLPALFDIQANISTTSNKINIDLGVRALADLNRTLSLQVVVIEREIDAGRIGITTGSNFRSVVKKMLPNAAGTFIQGSWASNTTKNYKYTWEVFDVPSTLSLDKIRIYDLSVLAIVVFIQDDATQEVYQTQAFNLTTLPDVVSGAEKDLSQTLHLYPNPANEQVFVGFEQSINQPYTCEVWNALGQLVTTKTMNVDEKGTTFNVQEWSNGLYVLKLKNKAGQYVAYKKMIVNK